MIELTEDSLTYYEELSDEKASFKSENAYFLWPMIVIMSVCWAILLVISSIVQCRKIANARCIITSESTQWGSVIYAGCIMSIVSLALHYKNHQRNKSQLALSFVCYFIAMLDVLIIRDVANEALGVPTTAVIGLWMSVATYSVRMAIFERPLTRGKRWKFFFMLAVVTVLFLLNFVTMCVLRFRFKSQTVGEVIVFIIGAVLLLLYVIITTIYTKKVKYIIFNAAK